MHISWMERSSQNAPSHCIDKQTFTHTSYDDCVSVLTSFDIEIPKKINPVFICEPGVMHQVGFFVKKRIEKRWIEIWVSFEEVVYPNLPPKFREKDKTNNRKRKGSEQSEHVG